MKTIAKISIALMAISAPFLSSAKATIGSDNPQAYVFTGLNHSSIDLKNVELSEITKTIGVGVKLDDLSFQVGYKHINSDYDEFNVSTMYDFYKQNNYAVYVKLDIGSGKLKLAEFNNSNSIRRIGAGLGVKYNYSKNISVIAEVLFNNFSDETGPAKSEQTFTFVDGFESNLTCDIVPQMCEDHGGIASVNTTMLEHKDYTGSGDGTEMGIAFRYTF